MQDFKTMQSGFKKQMRKICMCLKIRYWGGGYNNGAQRFCQATIFAVTIFTESAMRTKFTV